MKRSEASYTIEAVIIIPIILVVIVTLIQLCFVFHDRVIVRAELERFVTTEEKKAGIEISTEEKKQAASEIEKMLLLSDVAELQLTVSKKQIKASTKVKSKILVPFFAGKKEELIWEYSAERKRVYAKEKTIISEVVLDALHLFR